MSEETYITTFKEEHLEEASNVVTRAFLELNPIWKKNGITFEQVYPIIRGKTVPSINTCWSEVLMKGNQVIGVAVQYDLLDYLKMPSMPSEVKLFERLGTAGEVLQNKCDFSQLKRGDALYGPYGVLDPNVAGKGLSLEFWWYLIIEAKSTGWKYYYSRLSSEASLKMLCRLGAEVLAEVEFEGDKLWMVRVDFSKSYPSFTQLKAMAQALKNRPKL